MADFSGERAEDHQRFWQGQIWKSSLLPQFKGMEKFTEVKKNNLSLEGGRDHESKNQVEMDHLLLGIVVHCYVSSRDLLLSRHKQKTIILATTTSTQDSGLLDVLLPDL